MSNINEFHKKVTKPSSDKDVAPCNPNDVQCPMPNKKAEKSEVKDLYDNTGFAD